MTLPLRTSTALVAFGLGLGLAGAASAQTVVDFTVAEYSSKTGPYFQKVADDVQAGEPRHHGQHRSRAVGHAAAAPDH
jgi:multiple sugar transport system substrate-binding protein